MVGERYDQSEDFLINGIRDMFNTDYTDLYNDKYLMIISDRVFMVKKDVSRG